MLLILCLIYGLILTGAVAWATQTLHASLALGWTNAYLVAINLVAFGFYVYDKVFVGLLNALHIRVPELLLVWGLAFPGGWLGALAGMFFAHHKTGPDSADFRMKLLGAYAVSVTLALLVLVVARPPLISLEQVDAAVAAFVGATLRVSQAALEAVRAR